MMAWFGATSTGHGHAAAGLRWLLSGALVALAGCSKPPPPAPAPPTAISLRISAAADTNADASGQGAPVAIRVYQLKARSAFDGAEFFPLYHTDTAALGGDLVKKDEFLLIPDTTRSLTLMPDAGVQALGVFAAYADFQQVSWRASTDIPAHQTTMIAVTADRSGLRLTATPLPPSPAKPPSDAKPSAEIPRTETPGRS